MKAVLLIGLSVAAWARDRATPDRYLSANCNDDGLTVFPFRGGPISVPLPAGLHCVAFGVDGTFILAKGEEESGRLWKVEFHPTRLSIADTPESRLSNRSPDGKWLVYTENSKRERLVLMDRRAPFRKRILGRSGIMEPPWSPDSRYLVLEKWQWRCGVNLDVEVPETLELVDIQSGRRTTIRGSRCRVQDGVNGFVRSDIAP